MTGCSPCIYFWHPCLGGWEEEAIILRPEFLLLASIRESKAREKPGTLAIFLGNSTGFLTNALHCTPPISSIFSEFLPFRPALSVCSLE